eukprot:5585863-Pyramimonas_sp.AAC.1
MVSSWFGMVQDGFIMDWDGSGWFIMVWDGSGWFIMLWDGSSLQGVVASRPLGLHTLFMHIVWAAQQRTCYAT